jgi:aryl-alcohol dehydrogenase-like predicted oxidoreductase
MDIMHPKVVIGTNSWGSPLYERVVRGSAVDEGTLAAAVQEAVDQDIALFDTAHAYGMGACVKIMGRVLPDEAHVSAKFTPIGRHRAGRLIDSFERDARDLDRDYLDVYWLHLPADIEDNLLEAVALRQTGLIGHIGVSNFSLTECQQAQDFLARFDVPLYGVQNHFSLISHGPEELRTLAWCREQGIQYWGWAVLEEGLLAKADLRLAPLRSREQRLARLYSVMETVGNDHGINLAQVAIAYCRAKGVVPMVGCRRPTRVREASDATRVELTHTEVELLEQAAELCDVTGISGSCQVFRQFASHVRTGTGTQDDLGRSA